MVAAVLSLHDIIAPRNQQVAAASRRPIAHAQQQRLSAASLENGQGRSDPGLISYRPSSRSLMRMKKQERAAGEVRSGEWGGSRVLSQK
jgi:hypothetical protein